MSLRSTYKFVHLTLGIILLCSLVLGGVSPASAASRCYVKANATGINDGSSWANAYKSLQSALGASPCTEVWVAAGTYKPATTPDLTASFALKSGVAIYGGFSGTETDLSQRDPAVNVTTLTGELGDPADPLDNAYHVVTSTNVDSTAVLDGFTITAGGDSSVNDSGPGGQGGGMYNLNSSPSVNNLIITGNRSFDGGGMYNLNSSPSLTNITFSNNSTEFSGGGMYNDNSSPSLARVTFNNNSAADGGGMYNSDGNISLTDVAFSDNASAQGGACAGGMYNTGSATLNNVTFSGNSGFCAGGIFNSGSVSLTNVTFSGNSADANGGAMTNSGSARLTNVTISGNSFTDQGFGPGAGGVYNSSSSDLIITNSILYGNTGGEISGTATVAYSIVEGGYAGTGNLDLDPQLGPLQNNGGFTETMALSAGSPAIDAADDASCPATDQRGVTRPQGAHCDMGAYELKAAVPVMAVKIDIKPGSTTNPIWPRSPGMIPVVILSAPGFNAPMKVNRASLTFGRTGGELSLAFCNRGGSDVNADGLPDLVCHFKIRVAAFQRGDTVGILKGETWAGALIEGSDAVRILR